MSAQGNERVVVSERVVVTATLPMPPDVHQEENLPRRASECKPHPLFLFWCTVVVLVVILPAVIIGRASVSGEAIPITLYTFCFCTSWCCILFRHIAQRMVTTSRVEGPNVMVLRAHHDGEGAQQHAWVVAAGLLPPSTVVDRETRRSLLHYFVPRPSDEDSAEEGDLGCGTPGSMTSLESDKVGQDRYAAGSCIICFGDFAFGEELCRLPCRHLYHATCIDEWFDGENHQWCPLCKTGVLGTATAVRPVPGRTTTPTNITVDQEDSHDSV